MRYTNRCLPLPLPLEWNRVGVMDNDSGDDETDELRQFGCEKKNDQD